MYNSLSSAIITHIHTTLHIHCHRPPYCKSLSYLILTWFHFHSCSMKAESYGAHHAGTHKQENEYSVIP